MHTVGVLGAYGAVGAATARLLSANPGISLRLGGRNPARLKEVATCQLAAPAASMCVDVEDETALAAFCHSCDLVINCAGPSSLMLDKVGRSAMRADANYIDVGGEEVVHRQLSQLPFAQQGLTAILSTGLMPGLSAILPLWLARREFERPSRLTSYFCIRDHFTRSSAIDFLSSLNGGYGESLATWRNGERVSSGGKAQVDLEVPFFTGRPIAFPFLSREGERLAAKLSLREMQCYTLFDPGRVATVVLGLHSGTLESDLDSRAEALERAANFDLFGRNRFQLFVFQMAGVRDGGTAESTLVFRSENSFALTACVAAITAAELLERKLPPGVHFAADVMDPEATVMQLRRYPGMCSIEIVPDKASDEATQQDHGTI